MRLEISRSFDTSEIHFGSVHLSYTELRMKLEIFYLLHTQTESFILANLSMILRMNIEKTSNSKKSLHNV